MCAEICIPKGHDERMTDGNAFFERPILNSPYGYPERHWELDDQGQPTQNVIGHRRPAEFITPIPKPKKRKGVSQQARIVFDEGLGLSTAKQQYDLTAMINRVRDHVDKWRRIENSGGWRVTPETARLLQHWRHHNFSGIRPFFCQVEAVETAIWLIEVAPQSGKVGEGFLEYLANASNDANPELMRLALKLATFATPIALNAHPPTAIAPATVALFNGVSMEPKAGVREKTRA